MTFQFLLCKDTLFFSSCLPFSKEKEVLNGFSPFLGEKSPFILSASCVSAAFPYHRIIILR